MSWPAGTSITSALLANEDTYRCRVDKRFSIKDFENSLDPYQVHENQLVDDVAVWPPMEFGCIILI